MLFQSLVDFRGVLPDVLLENYHKHRTLLR